MFNYLVTFLLLTLVGYLYDKYRRKNDTYDETMNEQLIRKYLLNDGFTSNNKPPLWIYIENDINSREWLSFGSRNTYNLNQPYLYITIRSIINQSSNDFNVCIINDESIHKLIPNWSIDMNKIADPVKKHFRMLAMCKILYAYGGMVVPPSFVALRRLSELYNVGIQTYGCFTVELPSKSVLSNIKDVQPSLYFIGSGPQHQSIKEVCEELERTLSNDYTSEQDFNGGGERILNKLIHNHQITKISGKLVGCLDKEDRYISINELLGTSYIDFSDDLIGIYLPQRDIIERSKYQWFARLQDKEIYNEPMIISKYLLISNSI